MPVSLDDVRTTVVALRNPPNATQFLHIFSISSSHHACHPPRRAAPNEHEQKAAYEFAPSRRDLRAHHVILNKGKPIQITFTCGVHAGNLLAHRLAISVFLATSSQTCPYPSASHLGKWTSYDPSVNTWSNDRPYCCRQLRS
eukprot:533937-Amphidinium_carterae.1